MDFDIIANNINSYNLLDEGGTRKVFDIGNGYVMKVAHDECTDLEISCQVNMSEYDLYNSLDDKGYLCPIHWISDDGKYLVMSNANILDEPITKYNCDEFLNVLYELGADEDIESPMNWVGWYLIDYNTLQ